MTSPTDLRAEILHNALDRSRGTNIVLNLVGKRVALGPARRDLVPLYHLWEQQLDVIVGFGRAMPMSLEERQEAFFSMYRSEARNDFTVYGRLGADWRPIGYTTLNVDRRWEVATFAIALGERKDQGLGTEAVQLTLDWAFNVAGLKNVQLEVCAPNLRAIRAYEKAGFKHLGVRRNGTRWLGRQCDQVIMDAIPEDLAHSVVHVG